MEVINSVPGDMAPLGSRSSPPQHQQATDENDNRNFASTSAGSDDSDNGNCDTNNGRAVNPRSQEPEDASQQRQTQGSVASSSPATAAAAANTSNNNGSSSYKCLKAVELENLANNNTLLETVVEEPGPEAAAADNSCAAAVIVDRQQQQQLIVEQQLLQQRQQQLIEHRQQDVSSCQQQQQQSVQYRSKSESVSSQESHASSSNLAVHKATSSNSSSGSCHQAVSTTSSRHSHRVKFTEELPTASTGSYKRMTTTTSTLATAMTPEVVTDPAAATTPHPHITISEDFPTKDQDQTVIRSSYEGWDNPFRPEGEISHDADELLRLWKEGKLALKNGGLDTSDHDQQQQLPTSSLDSEVKTPLISQTETSINGNSGHKNGATTFTATTTTPTTGTVKREPSLTAKQVTIGPSDVNSSPKKPKKTGGCCSVM